MRTIPATHTLSVGHIISRDPKEDGNRYVQSTQEKYTQNAQPLRDRHLQTPDHGYRGQQDHKISGNTGRCVANEEVRNIYACSDSCWIHVLLPKVVVWSALGDGSDKNGNPPTNNKKQHKPENFAEG